MQLTIPTFLSETWKIVPSDPTLEASSLGRIRVVPYLGNLPNGGIRKYGGTPTFGQWEGRRFIYTRRTRRPATQIVAILVCEAFNGPKPFPTAVVMHGDENARNNVPGNLKWGTQQQNLNYPGFLAYCARRTGDDNPGRKGRKNSRKGAKST